jgi:glycyl-tRNA synthetase
MCITIDFESLENHSVTIRDRDSMKQERVNLSEVENYYMNYFK